MTVSKRVPAVSAGEVKRFRRFIYSFYSRNIRDLPWRGTTDAFHILVSEIMLQQTQVDRVIPYFEKFVERYPDVRSLAKAKTAALVKMWSGLGYNRRVFSLQKCAQVILNEHGGEIPLNFKSLVKLPGIGPYTANAVLAFAGNIKAPVVDVNIRRVYYKHFSRSRNLRESDFQVFVLRFVPQRNSSRWHNALMDYGSFLRASGDTMAGESKKAQSRFEGSVRQIRGKILKMLSKQSRITLTAFRKQIEDSRVEDVLKKLCLEKILVRKNGIYSINEMFSK